MKRVIVSTFERARGLWLWVHGWVAALRLLRDPNRLDQVFVLDRATPRRVAELVVQAARGHADGERALQARHRAAVNLERLRDMAPGTFGRRVADFYDANGLTPATIPTIEALDDVSYVTAHLYETHDVWHVATGFGTSVAEELGLQAVYASQFPGRLAPILIAGGLIQAALWVHGDFTPRLAAVARGFAMGKRARPLFGVRWDEMWELPVEDVRRLLGLASSDPADTAVIGAPRVRMAGA